jgi:hypothetical protein
VDTSSNQAHHAGDTLNLTLLGYGYALFALPDIAPGNAGTHREKDR